MPVDLPDWVPGVTPGANLLLGTVRQILPGNGFTSKAVIPTAGLTQLGILASSTTGVKGTVSVIFYQNAAMVGPILQQYTINKNTTIQTAAVVPVLGPFCQVFWTDTSGAGATVTLEVYGYATPFALTGGAMVGRDPMIGISNASPAFGTEFLPAATFPGPAVFWARCDGTANVKLPLMYWNGTGWIHMTSLLLTTAAQPYQVDVNLPMSDWRVEVDVACAGLYLAVAPA